MTSVRPERGRRELAPRVVRAGARPGRVPDMACVGGRWGGRAWAARSAAGWGFGSHRCPRCLEHSPERTIPRRRPPCAAPLPSRARCVPAPRPSGSSGVRAVSCSRDGRRPCARAGRSRGTRRGSRVIIPFGLRRRTRSRAGPGRGARDAPPTAPGRPVPRLAPVPRAPGPAHTPAPGGMGRRRGRGAAWCSEGLTRGGIMEVKQRRGRKRARLIGRKGAPTGIGPKDGALVFGSDR